MQIKYFKSEEEFVDKSISFFREICNSKPGTKYIGLSGGETPKNFYKKLAEQTGIDFSQIEFFLADERYVPLDHIDSNYKIVNDNLILGLGDTLKKFHYFETSLSLEKSLEKYNQEFAKIPKQQLDLVILGMGIDGHISSVFSGSKALDQSVQEAIHTTTDKFDIYDRLTLPISHIKRAKNLLLLLSGMQKKDILERLINTNQSNPDFPASYLASHQNLVIHYLE